MTRWEMDLTTDALLSDGSDSEADEAPPEETPEVAPAASEETVSAARPSEAGSPARGDDLAPALAAWTDALRSVERSINEAAESIRFLRATLQQMAPLLRSLGGLEEALGAFIDQPRPAETPPVAKARAPLRFPDGGVEAEMASPTAIPQAVDGGRFGREREAMRRKPDLRERVQQPQEAEGAWAMPAGPPRPAPRPITLVPDDTPAPYAYRVTVEDRKNSVELMQLHQALTSIAVVRNLALLNYVNGIASISLESTDELQPVELENALHKVMKRDCTIVLHDSNTFLVQLGDKS
ncbi:MAG: hypothetical protein ABSC13_00335 [Dehalococcoidia bacterium]